MADLTWSQIVAAYAPADAAIAAVTDGSIYLADATSEMDRTAWGTYYQRARAHLALQPDQEHRRHGHEQGQRHHGHGGVGHEGPVPGQVRPQPVAHRMGGRKLVGVRHGSTPPTPET